MSANFPRPNARGAINRSSTLAKSAATEMSGNNRRTLKKCLGEVNAGESPTKVLAKLKQCPDLKNSELNGTVIRLKFSSGFERDYIVEGIRSEIAKG